MFSKTCQYAFQAVIYIAVYSRDDLPIGQQEIAENQKLPKHFLGKILQTLVKKKLLKSLKGPNGGFYLAKPAQLITLMDIHEAIDGEEVLFECAMGFEKCSSQNPCPMHFAYVEVRSDIINLLQSKNLQDLIEDIELKKSFLSE